MVDGGYGSRGVDPQWPMDPANLPSVPGQPNHSQPNGAPGNYDRPAYGQPAPPGYGQPAQPSSSQPITQIRPGSGWPAGFQPYAPGYVVGTPTRKSRLRRSRPVIAAVVGVLLVLGIAAVVLKNADRNPGANHTLSAPEHSGDYTKLTGPLADRLVNTAHTMHGVAQKDTRVGLYAAGGSSAPEFVFVGIQSSQLATRSAANTMTSFMAGAKVSDPSSVDPGPLGGKMECGVSSVGQMTCVWSDHNTFGGLTFASLQGTAAQNVARTFRTDAEK